MKRIAGLLLIGLLLLAGAWGWELHRANIAFEEQAQIIRALRVPAFRVLKIGVAGPNDADAAILLRQAAGMIVHTSSDEEDASNFWPVDASSDYRGVIQQWVGSNKRARDVVRKASDCGFADWGNDVSLGEAQGHIALAKLIYFSAASAISRHDWDEVADDAYDLLRLRRAYLQMPGINGHYAAADAGIRAARIIEQAGRGMIPRAPGSARSFPPRKSIQALLTELLDPMMDRASADGARLSCASEAVAIRLECLKQIEAADQSLRDTDLPWAVCWLYRPLIRRKDAVHLQRSSGTTAPAIGIRQLPADVDDNVLAMNYNLPGYVRERATVGVGFVPPLPSFDDLALIRLAATAMAVRFYQADHEGKMPEKLQALVPTYLASLPADPFDPAGGSVRMAKGEPARLYSFGQRRRDCDGDPGRFYEDEQKRSRVRCNLDFYLDLGPTPAPGKNDLVTPP